MTICQERFLAPVIFLPTLLQLYLTTLLCATSISGGVLDYALVWTLSWPVLNSPPSIVIQILAVVRIPRETVGLLRLMRELNYIIRIRKLLLEIIFFFYHSCML